MDSSLSKMFSRLLGVSVRGKVTESVAISGSIVGCSSSISSSGSSGDWLSAKTSA